MALKGMTMTLTIIVVAVVILVTALVILTIFGRGIGGVVPITQAKSICETQAYASCQSFKTMPGTWHVPNMNIPTEDGLSTRTVSCSDPAVKAKGNDCTAYGVTTTPSGSTPGSHIPTPGPVGE
jgi:hypothetical protein